MYAIIIIKICHKSVRLYIILLIIKMNTIPTVKLGIYIIGIISETNVM